MSDTPPGRWSLRRRLGRSFAAIAVLVVLLGSVVVVTSVEFALDGNDLIYRWQPAAAASQRLLADLVNQETGIRGYILTEQSASLKPYRDYGRLERADEARLHDLADGDVEVLAGLREVEAAAAAWRTHVAVPVIAGIRTGLRPTLSALDDGRNRFDFIRAQSAKLTHVLSLRAASTRSSRVVVGIFAGVSIGLAFLVLFVAGVSLWRGLHRWVLEPVDRLGTQTRTVASGRLDEAIVPDGPVEFTNLGADVEGMRAQIVAQLSQAKDATEVLRVQGVELERSNSDLQQFAYVASHDLSEPLRKVANFCQLLERQYGPELDDRARQYIFFAVDGAKRMQMLIGDLLALSRVGRTTDSFVPVDLDEALDQALVNISESVSAAGARIERPPGLPTVAGDRTLLTSLLENLVGNAVKYRRDDVAPVVTIAAERGADEWTFTVRDNGIGIDQQYSDRIFAVFQRLHLRDQYGGTGIGLALCRKIVEFHGGRIWLDHVQSGTGAAFRFTLPEGGASARQVRDTPA